MFRLGAVRRRGVRRTGSRSSANSARKTSSSRRPTPPTSASGRGAAATSTSRPAASRRRSARSAAAPTARDNPVIGYPLAYQYLTSLRTDAVPDDRRRPAAHARARLAFELPDRLADARPGRAAGDRVPLGHRRAGALAAGTRSKLTGAVTTGTLSNPRVADDNGGKQLSAAGRCTPAVGLVVGASAARGAWLSRDDVRRRPTARRCSASLGADAEYSRDHWIVRGELVWSRWRLPFRCRAVGRRSRRRAGRVGRRALPLTPRIYSRRAGRPVQLLAAPGQRAAIAGRSRGTRRSHASRRRRRTTCSATSCSRRGAAQLARRPAASATARSSRRSWRTGSDAIRRSATLVIALSRPPCA